MPKLVVVYKGWIGAKMSDSAALEALGVDARVYNEEAEAFDHCSMTEDVYKNFIRKWDGYRVYGLVRRLEEVYTQEELDDVPF